MTLNPAVEPKKQVEVRIQTGRSVVPAEAGTHGKPLQERCFFLIWIPAFAGMTVQAIHPSEILDCFGALPLAMTPEGIL